MSLVITLQTPISQHLYHSTYITAPISQYLYHNTYITAPISQHLYHSTYITTPISQIIQNTNIWDLSLLNLMQIKLSLNNHWSAITLGSWQKVTYKKVLQNAYLTVWLSPSLIIPSCKCSSIFSTPPSFLNAECNEGSEKQNNGSERSCFIS